jgi:Tol biopolymer transport system component
LAWSPDGSQLMATISALSSETTYLLDPKTLNQTPSDITETMASVNPIWQKQQAEKDKAQMDSLPSKLKKLVTGNFKILSWSADETKILYTALDTTSLPTIITPRLIGTNSTPEQRDLKKDAVYVYDIKEDRNYKILDSLTGTEVPLTWFPDSKHLIFVHNQKVDIMEYDSTNLTTVYAGPFVDHYVFPWPDGSKIVILTNLGNPSIDPNLYTITLK